MLYLVLIAIVMAIMYLPGLWVKSVLKKHQLMTVLTRFNAVSIH